MLFYRLLNVIHHSNVNIDHLMSGSFGLAQLLLMGLTLRKKLNELIVCALVPLL
jgi:hypothetical protein